MQPHDSLRPEINFFDHLYLTFCDFEAIFSVEVVPCIMICYLWLEKGKE